MIYFLLFIGVLLPFLGVSAIKNPKRALDFQTLFTIRGKREYTDFAISYTVFTGYVSILLGIYMVVSSLIIIIK